jgi:hypothetical protein
MENRLAEVVDKPVIMEQNADEKMCSCGSDVVDEMCSSGDFDTLRDGRASVEKTPNQRLSDFRNKIDVCFCLVRVAMRKLIYPLGGVRGDVDNTIWRNGIIRIFY